MNSISVGLPSFSAPVSQLVNANQFFEKSFKKWALDELGWQFGFNRKLWEYAYILNALDVHGKLGGYGLGFGVGTEPTIPVMLRHGARLVVTDLSAEEAQKGGWAAMQAGNRSGLESRVVDMNHIPADLRDFDFLWSCGSLEHIGGLQNGLQFVERAMSCLKPAGVAVHTTEFLYGGGSDTLDTPGMSFYRPSDIEDLADRLHLAGHKMKLNLTLGTHPLDAVVADTHAPWEIRIREAIAGYVITSVGLIIVASSN